MDRAPTDYAAEHASAVAREVVRAGLADVEAVKKVYQEYGELLRLHGPRGTFTQLLLVRGVIDRAGFDRVQGAVPPDSGRLQAATAASQVFRLPTTVAAAPAAPSGPPAPPPVVERTMEFAGVLESEDPDIDRVGGRTNVFDQVIAAPLGFVDSSDALPPPDPALQALIGGGLGASLDELSFAALAPTPAKPPARPPSKPPTGRTPPSAKTPLGSGPSSRTPDPVVDTHPSGSVLDLPLTLSGEDPPAPRLKSTADSRTPGGPEPAEFNPNAPDEPRAYELGEATGEQAGLGKDFFLSSEEQSADQGPSEPQPGQVLGGYELLKVLGRGGMGVIYTAKKQGVNEGMVALKALLGVNDVGAERRRQRFRCEFEALRRLEHENIVRVFDFGREGPFDWYTMEFVEGKDFERLLLEGTLDADEKLSVFSDVCQALAHAHERQVVHRDVKPQNVIVDEKGRGHVLDFGLAKILDQGVGMTRTGSSLGTPFYMAPEQLKSAKHIDARADVFALGVMLYEIVTGQRPFPGETAAEVGNLILTLDPPRPSKVKKSVHPDLDAMCLKALEKDPERRYPDAAALHEDLVRHRKGQGVAGARGAQGAMAEARRWAKRNRAGLIGGLVASGLFVPALLIVAAVMRPKQEAQTTEAPTATATEVATVTEAPPTTTEPPKKPPTTTVTEPSKPPPPPPTTETPKPPPPPPTTETPKPPPPPPPTTKPPAPVTEAAPPSPVEVARAALVVPDEGPGTCGADQAASAHTTVVVKRTLVRGLETKVLPALAVGETARALEGVRALRATPLMQVSDLCGEVERDVVVLERLRVLFGERLKETPRLLPGTLELHGGERLRGKPGDVLEGGFLRVGAGVLDPLALELAAVRAVVLDAKTPHAGTSYALAVLGLYRGQGEAALDADFTAAGGGPAVQRRRKLADWLPRIRQEVWDAFEAQAAAEWRELRGPARRSDAQVLAGLDDYVKSFGPTAALRERRDEWLRVAQEKRTWFELLHAAKHRTQTQLTWKPLRGDGALDFEVQPLSDKQQCRVEVQSAALSLQNARVAFDFDDLIPDKAEVAVATREGLIGVSFYGMTQEVDPDAAWVVTLEGGREVGKDARRRPLVSPRTLEFDRNETHRVFRLLPQTFELPLTDVARLRPREPALTIYAAGEMRVSEVQLAWRDEDNEKEKAEKLTRKHLERHLLERLIEETAKEGQVLARLDVARPTALHLDGSWEATAGALAAEKGASARLAAWADLGVLRFKLAMDDGEGVRLTLRSPNQTGGGAGWMLPGVIQADPTRFREVVVLFDLKAKSVSVVVDGVRVRNPQANVIPAAGAVFGLELVGRTRASVTDLELVQTTPRGGLKP
jgi:serine/threonine-protein kinase